MISSQHALSRYAITLLLACAAILPSAAQAESIVWSSHGPSLTWTSPAGSFRAWLYNPMATVRYEASVAEVDGAGSVIRAVPCGSTVAKGTRLRFSYGSHTSDDIYWYGTGSAQDSPYGDWTAAEPPKLQRCSDKNLYASRVQARNLVDLHASLAIAPPSKTLTVPNATCTASGSNKTCTMDTVGTATAHFGFGATTGKYWGGFWEYKYPNYVKPHCLLNEQGASDAPMYQEVVETVAASGCTGKSCGGGGSRTVVKDVPYELDVPVQSITCPITVSDAGGAGAGPTVPVVTLGVGGAVSCVAGTPYSLSFSATSSQGATLRYGIDWDGNGSIDQYAPNPGYVPSGTVQTVTRTYATAGAKGAKVLAQDSSGVSSPWATIAFTCAANPNPLDADADLGADTGSGIGIGGGAGGAASPDLSLRAVPSLLRKGQTTKVTWSATRVTSCTVSGSNGDSWTGLTSPVGGALSSAISQQVIYTLSCTNAAGTAFSQRATVNVLPGWQEQ